MEHAPLIVAPSVLSADFSRVAEEVETVNVSGAKWVHLDVMDGCFVPNISFGPKFIKDLRPCSPLVFDTHLMIDDPQRYIELFAQSGSDYITVHAEATVHLHRTLQLIRSCGCKAGVAVVPSTPVVMIESVLDIVDQVLVMTVNPGFGGQQMIPSTLHKISELAELRANEGYNYFISVDGGINLRTVREVASCGTDVAVCGSAFFDADDRAAFVHQMIALAEDEKQSMKSVVQCVRNASVTVGGETVGRIEYGLLVYLGVQKGDTDRQAAWLCGKIAKLRLFPDSDGKRNLSVADVSGGILVVSQFTLCADVRKGNRPSYDGAEVPSLAEPIYERVVGEFASMGIPTGHGCFGAHMEVSYINDGPMTILLDA